MSENLRIWDAMKQVPPQYLKQITGGRLRGMSDINPQFRYMIMTETFGIVGIGWKWELKRVWSEPATNGQVFAFAEVAVYVKVGEKWSDPIPGIGGSMLVEKESSGLHDNDEGYKMAITDALSTALKMLGVAADVYAGLWDGTKYKDFATVQGNQMENKTGKPSVPSSTPADTHFCKEHNVPFTEHKKDDKVWWSHKQGDGWCNEDKKGKLPPEVEQIWGENLKGKPEPTKPVASTAARKMRTQEQVDKLKEAGKYFSINDIGTSLGIDMTKALSFDDANRIIAECEKKAAR